MLYKLIVCFLSALALAIACGVGMVAYHAECVQPDDDARRIFVPWVMYVAHTEYEKFGAIRDPERIVEEAAKMREFYPKYKVYVRGSKRGEEVVMAPRHFCFCRQTFIFYDHARGLEIIGE